MKTIAKFCVLMFMLHAGTVMMSQKASAQYTEESYQVFYDQLSPYGTWVEDPNYGYVWVPDVGPGFRPYASSGYWAMTEYGWTWVSRYRWGWAPFHYGRWYFEPVYGWIWVPGNEWGPAWVSWRRCNGFYGWTPMGPGINITMTFGPEFSVPADRWIFVRDRDFGRNDINQYYISRTQNVSILQRTTVITNTNIDKVRKVTYVAGPDKNEVQKVSARPVQVLPLREATKPGQALSDGKLQIYRPVVQTTTVHGINPAPVRVTKMQEVKPVSERMNQIQQKTTNPAVNQSQQRQTAQPQNKNSLIQQKVQPQQRTSPQGKTVIQPTQQHNTVRPVQQNRKQPNQSVKPVNKKPPEGPKEKENSPRK